MSFDYSPPRWWALALLAVIAAFVAVLGAVILLLGLLIYDAWHLIHPLLVFTLRRAPALLPEVAGPFR